MEKKIVLTDSIIESVKATINEPVQKIVSAYDLKMYDNTTEEEMAQSIIEDLSITAGVDVALSIIIEILSSHKNVLENTITMDDLDRDQLERCVKAYSNYIMACVDANYQPVDIYKFIEKFLNKFMIKPVEAEEPMPTPIQLNNGSITKAEAIAIGTDLEESEVRSIQEEEAISAIAVNPSITPVEKSVFDSEDEEDDLGLEATDESFIDPVQPEEDEEDLNILGDDDDSWTEDEDVEDEDLLSDEDDFDLDLDEDELSFLSDSDLVPEEDDED